MFEEEDLILKICNLHFVNHLNHVEIANQLKLSRFQVGRFIRKAIDENMITIKINEPIKKDAVVERNLKR